MVSFSVRGHVMDILGYPIEGVFVFLGTGYSLKDGFQRTSDRALTGQVTTDSGGAFAISVRAQDQDVGLQLGNVSSPSSARPVNVRQVTGTSIPFFTIELWSPDPNKWVNDLLPLGTYNDLDVYWDYSRGYLFGAVPGSWPDLLTTSDTIDLGPGLDVDIVHCGPWQANHRNADNPFDIYNSHWWHQFGIGSACHWGYPEMQKRERRINTPWGKGRGVIPFVVAEGVVVDAKAKHEDDFDRIFKVRVEPEYAYLPNPTNEIAYGSKNPPFSLEGEMCEWFLGREGDVPKTNIARTDELEKFRTSPPPRVWMVGTWCSDTGHRVPPWPLPTMGFYNEIHPVYWIVPFVGGWKRLFVSEAINLGTQLGAAAFAKAILSVAPRLHLDELKIRYSSRFDAAATVEDRADVYAESAVRLNQYGVNMARPGQLFHPANTLRREDHFNWARQQQLGVLKSEISRRLDIIYKHLTTLGSGYMLFPAMVYAFEGVELIRQADKVGVPHPPELGATPHPFFEQVDLARAALAMSPESTQKESLIRSYARLFDQMAAKASVTREEMANFYAASSLRFINYGIFADNDPRHSRVYSDHLNWALPRSKPDPTPLKDAMKVRIDALWRDLLPYTRRI